MTRSNFSRMGLLRKLTAKIALATSIVATVCPFTSYGQVSDPTKCGLDLVNQQIKTTNPNFDLQLATTISELHDKVEQSSLTNAAAKPTSGVPYTIHVVFHFVLDSAQVIQLGRDTGIQHRITSQLLQLNTDWNARNPDSIKIPVPFKPLYSNMQVNFVLATKDPNGNPTPGYEIKYTNKPSFDLQTGTTGTQLAFSDAKYTSAGGTDAWDPQKYYNVWVLNMTPAGVLGFSTPPPHPPYDFFPAAEQGSCIFYGAFGRKTYPSQYFTYVQATMGRTLTHESGHFFNLFHTWGTDTTCNDDDGISDTPLQGGPTHNDSPTFPVLDKCSPSFPGIMFMNFMDYAIDTAQCLFTKGQTAASHIELEPGGLRYSLTQSATSITNINTRIIATIYPNPVQNICIIELTGNDVAILSVNDIVGRTVQVIAVNGVQRLNVDFSKLSKGTYFIKMLNKTGQLLRVDRIIKE